MWPKILKMSIQPSRAGKIMIIALSTEVHVGLLPSEKSLTPGPVYSVHHITNRGGNIQKCLLTLAVLELVRESK